MKLTEVYQLIADGRLKESMEHLISMIEDSKITKNKKEELLSTSVQLSGKLARVERDLILGIIEYEKAELFKVRIGNGILLIAQDVTSSWSARDNLNVEIKENEIQSIEIYFKKMLYVIGLSNTEIQISFEDKEKVSINIPSKIANELITKIEKNYEENTGKAFQLIPKIGFQAEDVKKIIENVYTIRELEILKKLLSKQTSIELAEEFGMSIHVLNFYKLQIIRKFKSVFTNEELVKTANDVALYMKMIKSL